MQKIEFLKDLFNKANLRNNGKLDWDSFRIGVIDFWEHRKAHGNPLSGDVPETTEKVYTTKRKRKLTGKRLETFNQFWDVFNYKDGKADAADAWLDIPELTDALVKKIIASAKIEAKNRQVLINKGITPKMAQGWINSRRWEDEHRGSSPQDGARSLPEFKPPIPDKPDPNHRQKMKLLNLRMSKKITQEELEKRMEELDKNC